MRRAFAGFAGVNASVMTFLTERIEETLSGYTAPVVVNIFGNDLDVLDRKAQESPGRSAKSGRDGRRGAVAARHAAADDPPAQARSRALGLRRRSRCSS